MEHARLSTTEAAVLGLVALGERSGYDLARLAERSVGYIWTPSRSQIYKVLPRLVARGLARARGVRQVNRPDKALYTVTSDGRQVLRGWLEQVEEPAGGGNVFALKLFFCDLVPEDTAHRQLDGYRRFLESRLRRFESMLRGLEEVEHVFPQLVLRRAITRIKATLAWVDEVEATMESRREKAVGRRMG